MKNEKIALLIPTLNGGGAERVMSIMANYWIKNGRDVVLITYDESGDDFYALDKNIIRIKLKNNFFYKKGIGTFISWIFVAFALARVLRKEKINTVISFLFPANIINILSKIMKPHKAIVSERIDPVQFKMSKNAEFIRTKLYKYADIIAVQTLEVKKWGVKLFKPEKIKIVPNPININRNEADIQWNFNDKFVFLGMGRLNVQKGFDILIKAFSNIHIQYPDTILLIVGGGELKNELEDLATQLGISDKVYLPGPTKSPLKTMEKSDVFVLSSRAEGFPNVLLEAMAMGKPVISTNCKSGPSEIIKNGENGLLVPVDDIGSLANAMKYLLNEPQQAQKYATQAQKVKETYSLEKIMTIWNSIIE